jgi:glyoxylase-like metal-dependent hydrolase (beta-lactamase superfamily II)
LPTGSEFSGGVGNTQKDAARFDSVYAGVVAKIFDRLPDVTWVYPGHGGYTTLGGRAAAPAGVARPGLVARP